VTDDLPDTHTHSTDSTRPAADPAPPASAASVPAPTQPAAARPPEPTPLTLGHIAALVGLVVLTVIGIVIYSQEQSIADLTSQVAILRVEQQKMAAQLTSRGGFTPADVDVTGAPALGPAADVVTMIEFSDYECPFCIKHFTQTMPLIQANYIATGKIRYVFKDFPIDENHPMAIRAHEAAHCAMEQDKFWPMHVRLFSAPGTHTPDQLVARATEVGLDTTAFKACIASGRTTAGIRASADLVSGLGASGTPSFYLGKRDIATNKVHVVRMIDGAQPYSTFQQALDDLLK
jgi:protein-disulfide isomerase